MKTPDRRSYPSDISDKEWDLIRDVVPDPVWYPNMKEPEHPSREILNAIRYRMISDNYFCRLATITSAGRTAVRTACATVRS